MAHLCSGDLSPDRFLALIESHPWPEGAVLMAFTPAEARLMRFVYDSGFLSSTEQGRIFSHEGELRWRNIGKTIRMVYLGYSPIQNVLSDFSSELETLSPISQQLLLWGERTDSRNEWLEQQAPHRFDYPIDSAQFPRGRAALVVEQWVNAAKIPQFSRYHSIIEVKGGQGYAAG